MKHPERVEDYLEHIAEAIERATGYLQPVPDLAAFQEEPAGSGCGCPQHRDQQGFVANVYCKSGYQISFMFVSSNHMQRDHSTSLRQTMSM